jgi:hypothetical protein
MIYFDFSIRLFRPHNPKIVFNELIQVHLAHFLCHFLIKSFTNFIIQH